MKYTLFLLIILINILKISLINQTPKGIIRKDQFVSPFTVNAYLTKVTYPESNQLYYGSNQNPNLLININSDYSEDKPITYHSLAPLYTIIDEIKKEECSQNCLACMERTCIKCAKGLYSYGKGCYDSCPFETFADNVSLQCKWEQEEPVYIKAYTLSRCVNSCGRTFHDCSCNPRCKRTGDCCSDFQFCEIVNESHSLELETTIPNCKYLSLDKSVCLQCKDNFFYYKNSCLVKCDANTIVNNENKVCIDRKSNCAVLNCEKCENTNNNNNNILNNKCSRCLNGFYLHEGQCFKSCSVGLRANRINFTCQAKDVYSFYWIFPSVSGCKAKCGEFAMDGDCSCKHSCLRRGNCCDDFEKECKEELKKEICKLCEKFDRECEKCKDNAEKIIGDNNSCRCKDGYEYDLEEDLCYHKSILNYGSKDKGFLGVDNIHDTDDSDNDNDGNDGNENENENISEINTFQNELTASSNSNNNNTTKITFPAYKGNKPIAISNLNKSNFNKTSLIPNIKFNTNLADELLKSFKNIFTMHNPKNKNQILNLYMNGNISINVLTGNTNPQLITQNIYNKDSYNTNTTEIKKYNSMNKNNRIISNPNVTLNGDSNKYLFNRKKQNGVAYSQINSNLHTYHEKNFERENILKNSLNVNSSSFYYKDKEENITKPKLSSVTNSKKASNMTAEDSLSFQNETTSDNSNKHLNNIKELPFNDLFNMTSIKNDKFPVQNNYYISDHSIKVINSTNPSIISIDSNYTRYNNNSDLVVVVNKTEGGVTTVYKPMKN